ncbi:kinase-like domain-containing protein [Aspergillus carlsbadensis]|nr:kinase-like domain-containing protein [Aspergillus carlsbadensis]
MLRRTISSHPSGWSTRTMRHYKAPQLWRSLGPGRAEVPAKEGELYKYQRYRWLSGEPEKLASRYHEFRLPALLEAAVKVTNRGAAEFAGVKVLKCVEGQHNKAFILTMNTGQDIVARIPNPNTGPKYYTVASEVATRHFLRDCLSIPVPCIYAWSTDDSNAVGAEYILEEKAEGQPLGLVWSQLSNNSKYTIVKQIVEIEKKLGFVSLPGHRDSMADYAIAIGGNESRWDEAYAKPRMNFWRSQEQPETPAEYTSILQRFIKLAPHLVQEEPSGMEPRNRLCHPDLHLDNIFINPKTKRITSIIDWQHTAASPVSLYPPYPMDSLRRKLLAEPFRSIRLEPVRLVPCCWDREDLFSLHKSLISAVAHWRDIRIKMEELEGEMELREGLSMVLRQVETEGLIPLGGMIPRKQYENARRVSNYFKDEFLKLAEDEEQRKKYAKLWPYSCRELLRAK